MWYRQEEGFTTINTLGTQREPFLFIISYDKEEIFAQPLSSLDKEIFYKMETTRNYTPPHSPSPYSQKILSKNPIDFLHYKQHLEQVLEEIRSGNTYLLNLTFKTPIETDLSLKKIFTYAKAKFKLYYKDKFICFSPERFVEIQGNTIATYPMKGTIDATLPNAAETILSDEKEMAEHIMIVDLMRNDLGIIANNIKVVKFRYIEKIEAGDKALLQVSSKITATLPHNWRDTIGTLLCQLLPAGSISGTPKKSTLEIINQVETFKRGLYTGIFGIFDGEALNSAVMIRFIEKEDGQLYYKSGGGITIDSQAQSEYTELIDKIYIPI